MWTEQSQPKQASHSRCPALAHSSEMTMPEVTQDGTTCFGHCYSILVHLPTFRISEGFFLHFFSSLSLPSLIYSSNICHTTIMCQVLHEDHVVKIDSGPSPHGVLK